MTHPADGCGEAACNNWCWADLTAQHWNVGLRYVNWLAWWEQAIAVGWQHLLHVSTDHQDLMVSHYLLPADFCLATCSMMDSGLWSCYHILISPWSGESCAAKQTEGRCHIQQKTIWDTQGHGQSTNAWSRCCNNPNLQCQQKCKLRPQTSVQADWPFTCQTELLVSGTWPSNMVSKIHHNTI